MSPPKWEPFAIPNTYTVLLEALQQLANPGHDPETQCTVCGSDTATIRCCGWPTEQERTDER